MKRLFLFITLSTLCLFTGFSQTFQLSGYVKDFNQPVPDVDVRVANLNITASTDENGFYEISLPKGKHKIVFSKGNRKVFHVNIAASQTLDVDWINLGEDLDEILISAYRVDADSPISHSNLGHEEIQERNLGQDIPMMMNFMPSVVTTSDAGAGIGYTGIRVRGSDASRINTTINGVPLNDGESQGVFWVNLGDFTSSVEDLQLQRGVGTSANGAGAFGASLNIQTTAAERKSGLEITNTFGSFNTHKHQLKFDSGVIADRFYLSGNFGLSKSDGYRDRAWSDLKSYNVQAAYDYKNTILKLLSFGGSQHTYQAYYGATADELKENRRFNAAGMYVDENGETQFYDNQTDNYKQDHLQLLWHQRYDGKWSSNVTMHYTYGRGYYESYKQGADFNKYGLGDLAETDPSLSPSDLTNQKWLDNHFMGTVFDITYKTNALKAIFGGGWNRYWGMHYGEVIWAETLKDRTEFDHYYDNTADKRDYNFYAKATWRISDSFSAFADLQWRGIHYKVDGPYDGQLFNVKDNFSFFNPKVGLTYSLNSQNQLYLSYARANREPNRTDYKTLVLSDNWDGKYPQAEQLNDFELGWRQHSDKFDFNANLYFMDYHNQLVLTGEINAEGRPLRKNSGRSYRLGLEIESQIKILHNLSAGPNITLSRNQNKSFQATEDGEIVDYGSTEIAFSPSVIVGNQLRYFPVKNLMINFLSKYVGKQYMGNTEASDSRLAGYFVNDLNVQYQWKDVPFFKEIVFTGLINNIFDKKYSSNGTYSADYGASYYPQAGTNFLLGVKLRF